MDDHIHQMISPNIELTQIVVEGKCEIGEDPNRLSIGILDQPLEVIHRQRSDLDIGIVKNIGNVIESKGNAIRIRVYYQSGCRNECSCQQMQEGGGMPFALGFQGLGFVILPGFWFLLIFTHSHFSIHLRHEKRSERRLSVCSHTFDPKNSSWFE